MKFIDEARITIEAGQGGNGCVSFRREKYVPKGGPDGGDGGKGGDVIFKTSSGKNTLRDFQFKRHFKAQKGAHGRGKKQSGRSGKDLVIEVPPGTLIQDAETGKLLRDLSSPDESYVVARGGRGGLGNAHFASPTNRAPRHAGEGKPGESLTVKLELKLLADVGVIGLPNAGKSTLISRLSSARPKIADYPFTTLIPSLGVVEPQEGEPFVIADIPGLIEGAHRGVGLGTRFLRHVERTQILLHMIDLAGSAKDDIVASYQTINRELELFSPKLAEECQVVALNKVDTTGSRALAQQAVEALKPLCSDIWIISALTGEGLDDLKAHLGKLVKKLAESVEKERTSWGHDRKTTAHPHAKESV
jgi:GTP-binding protein